MKRLRADATQFPVELVHHELATWMRARAQGNGRANIASYQFVTNQLWLLRSKDCQFTDEEWERFSSTLINALRHRLGDEATHFLIYASSTDIDDALIDAVPDSDNSWIVTMVQCANYFEVSRRADGFWFTRFILAHGLAREGWFEFCAFARPQAPAGPPQAPPKKNHSPVEALFDEIAGSPAEVIVSDMCAALVRIERGLHEVKDQLAKK